MLPFERHIKGEEDKPLPPSKPRKPYKRNLDGKVQKTEKKRKRSNSDREMDSEVTSIKKNVTEKKIGIGTECVLYTFHYFLDDSPEKSRGYLPK